MRIVFVTETFLPSVDGVVTRISHALDWLAEAGHQVTIVCPDLGCREYAGFEVVGVPALTYPVYRSRPWGTPSKVVGETIARVRPDIVHVWHPAIVGARGVHAARKLGIPLITSYHTDILKYLSYYEGGWMFRRPVSWYMRYLNNSSPITLVTSQAMRARLEGMGVAGVRVLPRGVDLSMRDPSFASADMRARLTDNHPDQPLLLFVGRVAAEKSIESLAPLMRKHPGWRLAVVGSGPDLERCKRAFGGTGTVFTGFMTGQDLASAYACADAFVFPSTSEALGLVLLEAMASGTPVVAASSSATDEQVANGENGLVYKSAQELEDQLDLLLGDKGLRDRLRERGLAEAAACGWPAACEAVFRAYEDTLGLYRAGWEEPRHPGRPLQTPDDAAREGASA